MAARYLLETSPTDGYLLEDGSGVLLLEGSTPDTGGRGGRGPQWFSMAYQQSPAPPAEDDEESYILGVL